MNSECKVYACVNCGTVHHPPTWVEFNWGLLIGFAPDDTRMAQHSFVKWMVGQKKSDCGEGCWEVKKGLHAYLEFSGRDKVLLFLNAVNRKDGMELGILLEDDEGPASLR